MNIFILEKRENGTIDWKKSAESHDNMRVVKMTLETAQLLCTAINVTSGKKVAKYKSVHINHPSSKWARESSNNFLSLVTFGLYLSKEYTKRFKKTHKSQEVIEQCLFYFLGEGHKNFEKEELTPLPLCMPDKFKSDDLVESYRRFWLSKPNMIYPSDKIPEWFVKNRKIPYKKIQSCKKIVEV